MTTLSSRWLLSDRWLSDILGKPVYSLRPDHELISLKTKSARNEMARLSRLRSENCLIYAKTAAKNADDAKWLKKIGFQLIETSLEFVKKISPSSRAKAPSEGKVRFAAPRDEAAVSSLARRAFSFSRFHLDPLIPNDLACRIKSEWARNFFHGKRGKSMVIAANGQTATGFLLLLENDDGGLVIDLMAVEENWRGKGIGGALISFAGRSFPDALTIKAGTQQVNAPSISFYESLGFRASDKTLVFHRHGRTEAGT